MFVCIDTGVSGWPWSFCVMVKCTDFDDSFEHYLGGLGRLTNFVKSQFLHL